jgi:hypothetical protein
MFNFPHFEGKIGVDNTPTPIRVPKLDIACWTSTKDIQVRHLNSRTIDNPQMVELNATLDELVVASTKALKKRFR